MLQEALEQGEDHERAARCPRGRARRPWARRRRCRPCRARAARAAARRRCACRKADRRARSGVYGSGLRRRGRGRRCRRRCRAAGSPAAVPAPCRARLGAVARGISHAPDRYLGASPASTPPTTSASATSATPGRCAAPPTAPACARAPPGARPDVTIGTDAETWLRLREGELSGIEAFSQRLLYARGDLDLAVGFEGMFRLPDGRPPLLRIHDVPVGRLRVSTLTMGEGPDVLLLHGLGGTKSSFFDTAAALSRRYRVHALDFPGFGSSSQAALAPLRRRLLRRRGRRRDGRDGDRPRARRRQLDGRPRGARGRADAARARRRARAAVPRGRVRAPRLAPARARSCGRSSGCSPTRSAAPASSRQFWALFADRDLVDPSVADIVVDEFERIYRSPGARLAFLAVGAQHLPREARSARGGFYPRLAAAGAAGAVRLVLARQADPARLPAPRRALAAVRGADRARRLRPRAPGRAPGPHERPAAALLRAHRRARPRARGLRRPEP